MRASRMVIMPTSWWRAAHSKGVNMFSIAIFYGMQCCMRFLCLTWKFFLERDRIVHRI